MTVEVRLHDFCGDGCPFLEIKKEPAVQTVAGYYIESEGLTCEHYRLCGFIAERIKAQNGGERHA